MNWIRLKQEFKREKLKSFSLFLLMLIAVIGISSGLQIVLGLKQAIHHLFTEAQVPQLVQYVKGECHQVAIDTFVSQHSEVMAQQSLEVLHIDGRHIYLGNSINSQAQNDKSFLFVTQSPQFDFLLGLNNQRLEVKPGCIAVPLSYEKYLRLGDWVRLTDGNFDQSFQVTDFIRDAQMDGVYNSPKRLLINPIDYETLKANLGETDSLIEFQLKTLKQLDAFEQAYEASPLFEEGSLTNYKTFVWQTALPDGKLAGGLILMGLLGSVLIFFILSHKGLTNAVLTKYKLLGGLSLIVGYSLSLKLTQRAANHMALYMGFKRLSYLQQGLVFASVSLFFCLIMGCLDLKMKQHNQKAMNGFK